ncbi:MAG: hypothetical protein WCB68_08045 [Pyrinomonadaceae bacterium]
MSAPAKSLSQNRGPDLSEFRKRYPLTVANFGSLANREVWLRGLWETDARWRELMEREGRDGAREVVVRGVPPASMTVEAEFEIIYAGGTFGLLHAAVMAARYNRRVLVFDERAVGETNRTWNISDEELREFVRAGLFTNEEIEAVVVNRYHSGFVKFHDASSRVKTPPLWMQGVLDVAVDADKLLSLARKKIEESASGALLLGGQSFVRCYAEPHRVTVEIEDARTGRHQLFAARLFVDAQVNSLVARQLNDDQEITHICPTVGTVARGFLRGEEPDKIDFGIGEILVSNEDARDHRQLIWEGFAGSKERDEYATYLFFYDAVNSPADKSLLALFERYFETLPRYKRAGAQWRVLKPVFGYVPGSQAYGWTNRQRTSDDRLLLIGDAANLASPLAFTSFGAHVRSLKRSTHLTDLALSADLLDASSLSEINGTEARVAQVASLAEFMRPTERSAPATVNETLNAVMAALHSLDERVRRELFQDRMSWNALKNLLSQTVRLYPRIIERVREHLGARGAFWWAANIAEAAVSERRRARAVASGKEQAGAEEAAKKFARYARLYKNQHGADIP